MDSLTHERIARLALQIRRDALESCYTAGNGNIGSALSSVEVLALLYFHILALRPDAPDWPDRDRFVLSKGHAAPAFYATLARRGFFDLKELVTFRRFNSRLQTHPEYGALPGIDFGSGSLGQGLSAAVGMALAGRYLKKNWRVFVLMGDGETQEGQVWEAAMAAGHFNLDNLVAIIDNNRLQMEGVVQQVMGLEPLAKKWEAFGWSVSRVDGHNLPALNDHLGQLAASPGPGLLIADTVKGKGISFMEDSLRWHLIQGMTPDEFTAAMEELGGQEAGHDH